MNTEQIREKIFSLKGDALQEFCMRTEWYPQLNDLIGGWCVMPLNEPPSRGVPEVADFIDKKFAKHIAELHNNWLQKQQDMEDDFRSEAAQEEPY